MKNNILLTSYSSLLGTEHHKVSGDFRADVEGVPSVLRQVYGADDLPVMGLIRSKIWDQDKMMVYNFKFFFRYCMKSGASALSCSFISFQRYILPLPQVKRCY